MLKGKIIFMNANVGSKSEGRFPFLELEDGKIVMIILENDNPFENTALVEFEDKLVEAEGEFNENNTFIATEVKELGAIGATRVKEPEAGAVSDSDNEKSPCDECVEDGAESVVNADEVEETVSEDIDGEEVVGPDADEVCDIEAKIVNYDDEVQELAVEDFDESVDEIVDSEEPAELCEDEENTDKPEAEDN